MPELAQTDWTVGQYLDAVGSADPVPGGGAVAALVGAQAAALLLMVLSIAQRKAKPPPATPTLGALRDRAHRLRLRFQDLADADVAAYRGVTAALALPRSTDEERAARRARLQEALRAAAEVPLETARQAADALRLAAEVAPFCPRAATSDLLTAVQLARAACHSALANVDANALSLDESPFRSGLAGSCTEIVGTACALQRELLRPLEAALADWRARPDSPRPS